MTRYAVTVTGEVEHSRLGLTLSHEHLYGMPPHGNDQDLVLNNVEIAISEVNLFKRAAGTTIVEVTTPDYGRQLEALRTISLKTGINIIAATGFHKEEWSARITQSMSVEDMIKRFSSELIEGENGIRAGVIKVASSLKEITPNEEKVFIAAAETQKIYGCPITTHTEAGELADAQVELLKQHGAYLEKVIIGHLDRKLDIEYHKRILRHGVYIGVDQIGKVKYGSDEARAEHILNLIKLGYLRQILISGDLARRSYWTSFGGSPGLSNIPVTFVDLLARTGVKPSEIETLLYNNPSTVFAYVEK